MQFNQQLLEALTRKYGQAKALLPGIPGAAMTHTIAGSLLNKARADIESSEPTPAPAAPPMPPMPVAPPAMPPTPVISAPPAVNKPPISAPAPVSDTPPAMPQSDGQYNDAARQQLYADLAAKRKEGGAYAAVAGLGDMARRMGGSTGVGAQESIQNQVNLDDKTGREEFEAGRKGTREEMADYLKQKNDARDFGLKEKELGLKHEEIKANREVARGNKEMTVGLKQQQDDENRLVKLGDAMSTEKMRSGAAGQMSQSLAGLGKLKALMQGYNGNLTQQEWQEAAIAWNRVLTQGGVGGGEHSIDALVPHSLKGNIMGQIQWYRNAPTGTAQQEFAKRLSLGMDREEKYATEYVNKYKVGRLMDFQDVAGRKSDDVRMKLESQGIGFNDVAASNPALASKLWPQGAGGAAPASGSTPAPKPLGGGWTVRR